MSCRTREQGQVIASKAALYAANNRLKDSDDGREPGAVIIQRQKLCYSQDVERRISAILAADMVGYSRLMEADELAKCAANQADQTPPSARKRRIAPYYYTVMK